MNQLTVTEFKDIRVLTTQQLAEQYETTEKVISNNFNNNKERYQEGKHYIILQGEELKEYKSESLNLGIAQNVNKFYLWTEKGCFLHAKSLNTDKAWEVYDTLVETYFKKSNLLDGISTEMQALLMHDKKIQAVIEHVNKTENRVDKLENNMTIDYGQQKVLERLVNVSVVNALGGKGTNAYKEIGKKVFKECNRDIQDRFDVNSRSNVPKLKFEDACAYIKRWQPCTNTKVMIEDYNNQMNIA